MLTKYQKSIFFGCLFSDPLLIKIFGYRMSSKRRKLFLKSELLFGQFGHATVDASRDFF